MFKDDELEEEKSLLDSANDSILKSPSESINSTSPDTPQPTKKVSLKRNISITVPIIESKSQDQKEEEEAAPTADEPDKKVIKISELTAKDRLELRAKKFSGTESSSLGSSQDKLQARAARFGTAATTEKSGTVTSTVSLDVLKKRAERFGTVIVPELKKSEMNEKLQKRQERFGASEKVTITGPKSSSGSDSEYKEKALKRLERFKQAA